MGGRRELATAVAAPGAWRELQAAVVTVAGVDRPVAAGFAACDDVPLGVGGGLCLGGESDAAAAEHRTGEGDLGNTDGGVRGLTVPSAHVSVLSRARLRGHCRVRAGCLAQPRNQGSRPPPRDLEPRPGTRRPAGPPVPSPPPSGRCRRTFRSVDGDRREERKGPATRGGPSATVVAAPRDVTFWANWCFPCWQILNKL